MTYSNSDKLKLHRGSISSASVPNDHQSTQRSRHARSRLTIIPLPSSPTPSPQRPSRTSFSASSFSRQELIPELPAYSRPLNPQQVYDLAISSLHLPDRDAIEGTTASTSTAPIRKSCSQSTPKPTFIPVTRDLYLPFVDRPSEVASLFQHSTNNSLLKLIEIAFSDQKQLSDFRHSVFEISREEADDKTWISTIRAILKPRSEILWTRLKAILGVPPELDEDDPQLHNNTDILLISDISGVPADVMAQVIFPDRFKSARPLVMPSHKKGRLRADTQPIIEEVESTPTDDTASSHYEPHEPREDNVTPTDAAGICIQTTPLFVPGITPIVPKPGIENAQYSKESGPCGPTPHGKINDGPSPQSPRDSPSAVSSSSPISRDSGSTSFHQQVSKHHPVTNRNTNRSSPSGFITPSSEVLPETRKGNKERETGEDTEEQGESSDVSDLSSASTPSEKDVGGGRVMTGTGDTTEPRKPSLQRNRRASDIPSRDLPPLDIKYPPAQEDKRDANGTKGQVTRPDKLTRVSPSNVMENPVSGSQSPTFTTFLSKKSVSPNHSGPSQDSTGKPHFPASFSKSQSCSVRRFPPSSPGSPVSPTNTIGNRRAGHLRSHTVSHPTSSQQPTFSSTHAYPPPPPPTPSTPNSDKKDTRSRRAVSVIQRHAYQPSELLPESCEEDRDEQDGAKENGKLFVEVEGPISHVCGTENALDVDNTG
ncbi:hypothetical protein Clacol_002737 [Clathrus columnatus]|uniref:Uncharacterized protein n=1 Tax=Clathrus columnatus TaxID=1419009 RepID=A0AAV5A1L2_9AGAM|nr:hypothetical protein Clacol_002737 [Clathrus columnatus]